MEESWGGWPAGLNSIAEIAAAVSNRAWNSVSMCLTAYMVGNFGVNWMQCSISLISSSENSNNFEVDYDFC